MQSRVVAAVLFWVCAGFSVNASAAGWSGFYLGGHLGLGSGADPMYDDNLRSEVISYSGLLGGVTAGYNHLFDKIILGGEVDFSFSDMEGSGDGGPGWPCGTTATCTLEVRHLATLRARVGYDMKNVMPYGSFGVAMGKTYGDRSGACPGTDWCGDDTPAGTVIGGGVEFFVMSALTVKVELLSVDLGRSHFGTGNGGAGFEADFSFIVLRGGVNYRF